MSYTGTYIDSSDVLDDDIKVISDRNTQFYIQAEAWFTSLCNEYGATTPVKADITFMQMRAIVVKTAILVCQSKTGQTAEQLQDGNLDKYARKLIMYSNEFYGSNQDPKSRGLLDMMVEQLTRGTDQMQYDTSWNY